MISHKKGEFIGLSAGEYSDYRFNGLFRAKKDIDLGELAQQYFEQCQPTDWDSERKEASDQGLGAWLVANQYVKEVEYDEVHCGSYDFELSEIMAYSNNRANELAKKVKS